MYEVRFAVKKPMYTPYLCNDAFTYTPEKGWQRLQKICFWILDKIGAHKVDYKVSYETITIDGLDFIGKFMKQSHEIQKQFNTQPKTLYIGKDDYFELMNQKDQMLYQKISFKTEYMQGAYNAPRIYGLDVHIIPWMKGFILI